MEKRIKRICSILSQEYKEPDLGNKKDPVDELVYILLSEKTDEAKYVQAYRNLRENFGSWNGVCNASLGKVCEAIHSAGMSRRKAALIQRMLRKIKEDFGRLDLSALSKMSQDEAEEILIGLPGIGKKAARCVLLYCFGFPALPVDIHTYRLAIRLGIISRRISYEQAHSTLPTVIPTKSWRTFHINAVAHGRRRCFAKRPICDGCSLDRFCKVRHSALPLQISVRPQPLAIELFSGSGGMSRGFCQAGFNLVYVVEADAHAAATFQRNHPGVSLFKADVRSFTPESVLDRLGIRPGDLTVLLGGPPCQGFSESNRRTRTIDNPRNYLYREFLRVLRVTRPAWFVLENVAGLKTLDKGRLLNDILKEAGENGYSAQWKELNSVDYGVPQYRRRIFIIGNRLGLPIKFPAPTHGPEKLPIVTVRDAISDLPYLKVGASVNKRRYRSKIPRSTYQELMRSHNNDYVEGNLVTRSSPLIVERYRHIKPGKNWESIPSELMDNYTDSSRCHTGIYYRLRWDEPSKVIGNFRKNMLIHPSQNRGLSVREAARLQSFPDDYAFVGSIGFQQQQVADAVPPLLAQCVASYVRKCDRRNFS